MWDKFQNSALERLTGIPYIDKLMKNNPMAKLASNPIFELSSQQSKIFEAVSPFHNLVDNKLTTQFEALKINGRAKSLLDSISAFDNASIFPANYIDTPIINHFKELDKMRELVNPSWVKSYGFLKTINESLSLIPKLNPLWTEIAAFQKTNNKLLDALRDSANIGLHHLSVSKNTSFDELINSVKSTLDQFKHQQEFEADGEVLNNIETLIEDLKGIDTENLENKIVNKVLSGVKTILEQSAKSDKVFALRLFVLSLIFTVLIPIIQANWDSIIDSIYPKEQIEQIESKVEKRKLYLLPKGSYLRTKPDSCDDSNKLTLVESGTLLIKVGEVPYWNYVVDITTHQSGWISKRLLIDLN